MPVPSPRNPILPARGSYAALNANLAAIQDGEVVFADDQKQFYIKRLGVLVANNDAIPASLVLVNVKADLPAAVAGVITLAANTTYFFLNTVDLTGDRLVCSSGTSLIGGSLNNSRIKSTGLSAPLISSQYSLTVRDLAIEATAIFDLNASGAPGTTSVDFFGVNIENASIIGTIANYALINFNNGAFNNSAGLYIDGTVDSLAFNNLFFQGTSDLVIIKSTCVIQRRIRASLTGAVVIGPLSSFFEVQAGAIIPNEGLQLIDCSLTLVGGATAINGLGTIASSNIILIVGCKGVENTAVIGQMYMQGNATATVVGAVNTFVKAAGVTTASDQIAKYTHSNNRLTNNAVLERRFLLTAQVSVTAASGVEFEVGFFDSHISDVRVPSRGKSTTTASNRPETVTITDVVQHGDTDYIEIWVKNNTNSSNLTVASMNVIVSELN